MSLKLISLTLVIFGTIMLIVSLFLTNRICRDHTYERPGLGWRLLYFLTGLFIVGYIAFMFFIKDLEVSIVELIVSLILFGGGWFVVLVARMSLISIQDIKRIAALERHNALHDDLTNLPNRKLLYERVNRGLLVAIRNKKPLAVMIMDLDQFKEVNDTLGHHCGDRLLQQVAPRLKKSLRETDSVARLGGDEFAMLLTDTDAIGAMLICDKILQVMDQPFAVEGHSLKVGVSIGIAEYPKDGQDSDSLLQKADVAMYVAKQDAIGYSIYDPERDLHTLNRLMIIGRLHEAIKNNELKLHYQPIMNIKSGEVWGVEALVRWTHKDLGEIEPAEFIPIAEQSGMIKILTSWVLERAFKDFHRLESVNKNLNLSVNLSVKDIQDAGFMHKIKHLLQRHQIDKKNINIEITESSMMTDSKRAHDVIKQLHDFGIKLSIDDFGTGFSSLSYLKQLPAGCIKIDRTFITDMFDDDNDAVIVRSTIDLAHNMGRTVIAEGVESQDIMDILEILGCDFVQGYYTCKPLPLEQLVLWLEEKQGIGIKEVEMV